MSHDFSASQDHDLFHLIEFPRKEKEERGFFFTVNALKCEASSP